MERNATWNRSRALPKPSQARPFPHWPLHPGRCTWRLGRGTTPHLAGLCGGSRMVCALLENLLLRHFLYGTH